MLAVVVAISLTERVIYELIHNVLVDRGVVNSIDVKGFVLLRQEENFNSVICRDLRKPVEGLEDFGLKLTVVLEHERQEIKEDCMLRKRYKNI